VNWQPSDLIAFEQRVADAFAAQQCKGPVHLSGGNESQLIEIFKDINKQDWIFSFYRGHYHALLHGIDPEWLFAEILAGRSMNIMSPEHRFFTSAIVGGCLPIAVGVAAALKRQGSERKVWCFIGDMCFSTGAFRDAVNYSRACALPIKFVVEDNDMSCDSPTMATWGYGAWLEGHVLSCREEYIVPYVYKRTWPHVGIGRNVF
jgi:pyruvate dehydrogenase E1 component alpha subunit